MTCIVGLETPTGVIIGGDSAGVAGWDLDVRADTKVFTRGPYAFGFTSSFRMGQLLRYALSDVLDGDAPSSLLTDDCVDRWMATEFVDAVRALLKAGGYAKRENEVEEGGTFLVGVAGRLYEVHSDYQVARSTAGFSACGCGAQIALGAMYVSARVGKLKAPRRVYMALEAAERFSAGVRGPMHLVEV